MTRELALACATFLALASGATARDRFDFRPVGIETQALMEDYRLPGASVRLARNGQVVYRQHFGNYGDGQRVAIASASKWLSALTLARIVESGHLRWDDPVGRYFPDAPVATRGITLAQLFSHTSGIANDDAACLSSRATTLQACGRDILAMPLQWTPGTSFAYGGNSMQVAGAMAEIATGRSWDALFIAEMVQPLGLVATDWTAGAVANTYVANPNPRIGGGARSTLDDYGRVLDMLLAGGLHEGRSFLSAQTLATMALDRTPGLVVAASPVAGYGYGYGIGQWVELKDAQGATLRVSSPGAFGFTPWVDWRSGSNGVVMVYGIGSLMRDDLTALEATCLRQLDFRRELQSDGGMPRTSPSPSVTAPFPGTRPTSRALRSPARLPPSRARGPSGIIGTDSRDSVPRLDADRGAL